MLNKKDIFELFDDGSDFAVAVSTPHGAKLPDGLNGMVVLQLGRNLTIPVTPSIDDDSITVRLSFNRQPFTCIIPWESIQAIGTIYCTVTWELFESPSVEKKPGLSVVK